MFIENNIIMFSHDDKVTSWSLLIQLDLWLSMINKVMNRTVDHDW